MADLPALFSGPMVGALLADLKTQTRRANHLERLRRFGPISEFGRSNTSGYDWHFRDKEKRWHDLRHAELLSCLPWRVGDRLYVREAWRVQQAFDGYSPAKSHGGKPVVPRSEARVRFVADGDDLPTNVLGKFRQAMHMPRWASRITLTVTDVRVERLQSISEADAIAEGVERLHQGFYPYGISTFMTTFVDGKEVPAQYCTNARDSYSLLWDSINGRGAWQANPWVAAYTFTVALGNIDQIGRAA